MGDRFRPISEMKGVSKYVYCAARTHILPYLGDCDFGGTSVGTPFPVPRVSTLQILGGGPAMDILTDPHGRCGRSTCDEVRPGPQATTAEREHAQWPFAGPARAGSGLGRGGLRWLEGVAFG